MKLQYSQPYTKRNTKTKRKMKAKINKGPNQFYKLWRAQETINKTKGQPREREKIFENYRNNKDLVWKRKTQINNFKNPLKKKSRRPKKTFFQRRPIFPVDLLTHVNWWSLYEKHCVVSTRTKKQVQKNCHSIQQSYSWASVQSLSHVQLFVTPWTTVGQASLSITNSRSPP